MFLRIAGLLFPGLLSLGAMVVPTSVQHAGVQQARSFTGQASSEHFTPVTIKELRADPKGFAQKNVAVSGRIGEISRAEQFMELIEKDDSLRVLLDELPANAREEIYAAKPGTRATAYGQFSGYVLYGARVRLKSP